MAMSKFIQMALSIALSVIAAATTVEISRAQSFGIGQEQPIGRESPPSTSETTAQNVQPADPAMAGGVPVMYFGVNSCGTKLFWLVMEDGRMFRLDADHHPKDMEALMHSIQSLPHDLVEIPCASHL
jgi:hypothetical protein